MKRWPASPSAEVGGGLVRAFAEGQRAVRRAGRLGGVAVDGGNAGKCGLDILLGAHAPRSRRRGGPGTGARIGRGSFPEPKMIKKSQVRFQPSGGQ
jgi:hypothetical protein